MARKGAAQALVGSGASCRGVRDGRRGSATAGTLQRQNASSSSETVLPDPTQQLVQVIPPIQPAPSVPAQGSASVQGPIQHAPMTPLTSRFQPSVLPKIQPITPPQPPARAPVSPDDFDTSQMSSEELLRFVLRAQMQMQTKGKEGQLPDVLRERHSGRCGIGTTTGLQASTAPSTCWRRTAGTGTGS